VESLASHPTPPYLPLPPPPPCAEFYGREYALFDDDGTLNGVSGAPRCLGDLMASVDATKRRLIVQRMAALLSPVMDKGLMDSQILHR
jgi:hypothetical protein